MQIRNGTDIAKRAMMAHMETIRTAGNNIANVNTPGYSRQRFELTDTLSEGQDMLSALSRRRVRDQYVDNHIRYESQTLGEWEMKSQLYGQIENVFLEPSENGLNAVLSEFWNSWADLSNDPDGAAARAVVVQQGTVAAESIKHLDSQLKNLRTFADSHIENNVTEINDIAVGIAQDNANIVSLEASGEEASETRDHRDMLLEKLSRLANTTVVERESGSTAVMIGGRTIVDDAKVMALDTQKIPSGAMMVNDVIWADDGASTRLSGGEMAGLIDIRDNIIPGLLQDLDTVAVTLITEVNNIHSTGYGSDGSTGLDFFTGSDASNIAVSGQLIADTSMIATSGTGEPGDNSVALSLAELVDATVAPGTKTIGVFYSNILENLGAESRSATMMKENSETLLGFLEEQKENVAGVSLDEEAADLVRFQHAYQAAAQYMSVVNEAMDILLSIGS